jgi:tetratricopeptide (TPR) repeat protein
MDLNEIEGLFVFDDFHKAGGDIIQLFRMFIELLEWTDNIKFVIITRELIPFYSRVAVEIKNIVSELRVTGLDKAGAVALLTRTGIDARWHDLFYKLTAGHPLFLELIRPPSGDADRELERHRNIELYIEEEIFSKLSAEERTLLGIASVYRSSVTGRGLLLEAEVTYETISRLVKRALLHEVAEDRYQMHELIKKFFYMRLSGGTKHAYHLKAAEYYARESSDTPLGQIEAQYHYLVGGEPRRAVELAIKFGKALIQEGYADKYLTTILQQFASNDLTLHEWAEVQLLIGEVYRIKGDWEVAFKYYRDAIETAAKVDGNLLLRARAYRAIAYIQCQRAEWRAASETYKISKELSEHLQDLGGVASAYRGLGYVCWRLGKYPEAVKNYTESLKLSEQLHDTSGSGITYIDLGNIYCDLGEWETAREYYHKSLDVLNNTSELPEVARAYNNLGDLCLQREDWDGAINYFEKCRQVTEDIGASNLMAWAIFNMSEAYMRKGMVERAIDYNDVAHELLTVQNDKLGLAAVYMNYGLIYRFKREWDRADTEFQKSIELFKSLNVPFSLAQVYYERGMMHLDNRSFRSAKSWFTKSLRIFNKLGATKFVEKVDAALAKLKSIQDDPWEK